MVPLAQVETRERRVGRHPTADQGWSAPRKRADAPRHEEPCLTRPPAVRFHRLRRLDGALRRTKIAAVPVVGLGTILASTFPDAKPDLNRRGPTVHPRSRHAPRGRSANCWRTASQPAPPPALGALDQLFVRLPWSHPARPRRCVLQSDKAPASRTCTPNFPLERPRPPVSRQLLRPPLLRREIRPGMECLRNLMLCVRQSL